jgi:hypothetical protein
MAFNRVVGRVLKLMWGAPPRNIRENDSIIQNVFGIPFEVETRVN